MTANPDKIQNRFNNVTDTFIVNAKCLKHELKKTYLQLDRNCLWDPMLSETGKRIITAFETTMYMFLFLS